MFNCLHTQLCSRPGSCGKKACLIVYIHNCVQDQAAEVNKGCLIVYIHNCVQDQAAEVNKACLIVYIHNCVQDQAAEVKGMFNCLHTQLCSTSAVWS